MAAYFAFREVDDEQPDADHVKIYAFSYMVWNERQRVPDNLLEPEPFIRFLKPPARLNPRLIAQHGAFTISNVETLDDHILSLEQKGREYLPYLVRMPVKDKPVAIRDLEFMGINERSLFPGLDGACRRLETRFFTASQMGKTPSERMEDTMRLLRAARIDSTGEEGGT
jgi:hypothetical protein